MRLSGRVGYTDRAVVHEAPQKEKAGLPPDGRPSHRAKKERRKNEEKKQKEKRCSLGAFKKSANLTNGMAFSKHLFIKNFIGILSEVC